MARRKGGQAPDPAPDTTAPDGDAVDAVDADEATAPADAVGEGVALEAGDGERVVMFTLDKEVRDHNGAVTDRFEAGEQYVLVAPSAERWVRRAAAVYVD